MLLKENSQRYYENSSVVDRFALFKKEEEWKYFDKLRYSIETYLNHPGKRNETSSSFKIKSVETNDDSSLVKVSIHNSHDGGSGVTTYRLMTLPNFFVLLWKTMPSNFLSSQAKASLMAVRDFNSGIDQVVPNIPTNDDERCNIRLVPDFYETNGSPISASRQLSRELWKSKHPFKPAAVVGAGNSDVSKVLSVLNSVRGVPQVSHLSAAKSLDDDPDKLFGRIIPSLDGEAEAAVNFFLHITKGKIKHFCIIYVSNELGKTYRNSVVLVARRHGIQVKSFGVSENLERSGENGAHDSVEDAVKGLADWGVKYVVAVTTPSITWLKSLINEATQKGVIGPGYLWLLDSSTGRSSLSSYAKFDPNTEGELSKAFHGLAHLRSDVDTLKMKDRSHKNMVKNWKELLHDEEFLKYLDWKQPRTSDTIRNYTSPYLSPFYLYMYDTVMAIGIAACKIDKDVDEFFNGTTLFETFKSIQFDGASGKVKIDPKTGTRDYRTLVYTIANVKLGPVNEDGMIGLDLDVTMEYRFAEEDDTDNDLKTSWTTVGNGFNFSDFTLNVPNPLPPLEENKHLIGTPLKVFGLSLCVMVLLFSFFFSCWTYANRKSRVVKASQPIFLFLICVGTFTMGLSIIPLSFEEPPMSQDAMDFSCMAFWWLYCSGFVLTMTALFSKTWRINKIMGQKSFRRVKVEAKDVLLPGMLILICNFVILLSWSLINPSKYQRSFQNNHSSSADKFGRKTNSIGICTSKDEDDGNKLGQSFFLSLLFFVNGGVLIVANHQAWKARKIATEYSESQFIGYSMISLLQISLIGTPMMVVSTSFKGDFIFKVLFIFVSSGAILFLIFLPKTLFHWKLYLERKRRRSTERSNGTSQMMMSPWQQSPQSYENAPPLQVQDSNEMISNSAKNDAEKIEDGDGGLGCHFHKKQSEKEKQILLKRLLNEARSGHEELLNERNLLLSKISSHVEESIN